MLQESLTKEIKKVLKDKISENEQTLDSYRVQIKQAYNNYLEYIIKHWVKLNANEKSLLQDRIIKFQNRAKECYQRLSSTTIFVDLFDLLEYKVNDTNSSLDTSDKQEYTETNFSEETENKIVDLSLFFDSEDIKMENKEFLKIASSSLNKNFSGEPSQLLAFVNSIKLLETLAITNELKQFLVSFIKTRLEGRAIEIINDEHNSIQSIINALNTNIKYDNSKVLEGRMLALRYTNSTPELFAKKADELAVELRRSLISEGMTPNKASEIAIDRTVELCRLNTNSDLVKSVLEASSFASPNEVIAKLITQNDKAKKESQSFSFKTYNNQNKPRGFNRFRHFSNRDSYKNNFRSFNNKQANNNNHSYNGNKQNNFNNNSKGYRKKWRNSNNHYNKTVRYFSGNESSPQQSQNRATEGLDQLEE